MRAGAVAALLLLVACSREQPADAAPASAAPPPAAPASAAPEPATPAAASGPQIALDGEGLRLVADTGSTRLLPFGAPASAALETVGRILGGAPERSGNGECGAGPLEFATWEDGLQLAFQEDRFVGWSVQPGAAGRYTTMSGAGVGGTRADLAAYDARVSQTTLGTEFTAGGLSGLLASDAPDAKITSMWAGLVCTFR